MIEDYFIYRMTGKFATEGSLVCSSTYWDIIQKCYWKEMLDYLGVRKEQFPPVYESGEVIGQITKEPRGSWGFPEILQSVPGL